MKRLLTMVVVLATPAWTACDRSTVTTPDGSKLTVDREGNGAIVSVKDRAGESTTLGLNKEVALPEGFPPALAYPGAKVIMGMKNRLSTTAHFTTADMPQKVTDFYQARLKADGWVFGEFGVVLEPDGQGGTLGGVLQANQEAEKRLCRIVVGRNKNGDTGVSETYANVTVGASRAQPAP